MRAAGTFVLSVTLTLTVGCAGDPAPVKTPTAVRVRAVEHATSRSARRYSATINPASRVDVAFKVGGYVQKVGTARGVDGKPRLLQEGDHVSMGDMLAELRSAEYAHKLDEAKAALGEAMAAREQSKIDFDRAERLAASESVSKAELDAARVKLDAATARLKGAHVRVAEARTSLDDTRLRSPMDGVVVKRSVEVGTLAAPGTVALSIADTATVKVVYGVPDTEVDALRLGTKQTVTTEALRGREFDGRITRISPVADPKSRVFEVEVTLDNPVEELKPGMIASLRLNDAGPNPGQGRTAPLTLLPLNAVVRSPSHAGQFAVYVVDTKQSPPQARLREVEIGEFLGNQVPIRGGLADGDQVIVMGAALVSEGEAVQVIP